MTNQELGTIIFLAAMFMVATFLWLCQMVKGAISEWFLGFIIKGKNEKIKKSNLKLRRLTLINAFAKYAKDCSWDPFKADTLILGIDIITNESVSHDKLLCELLNSQSPELLAKFYSKVAESIRIKRKMGYRIS